MSVEDITGMVRRQTDSPTHKLWDALPKLGKRGLRTTIQNLALAVGASEKFVKNKLINHFLDVEVTDTGEVIAHQGARHRLMTDPPKKHKPGATGIQGKDSSESVSIRVHRFLP